VCANRKQEQVVFVNIFTEIRSLCQNIDGQCMVDLSTFIKRHCVVNWMIPSKVKSN
jgi:hypothetical protein